MQIDLFLFQNVHHFADSLNFDSTALFELCARFLTNSRKKMNVSDQMQKKNKRIKDCNKIICGFHTWARIC